MREIVQEMCKARCKISSVVKRTTRAHNLMNLDYEIQQHARCTAEDERPVKVIDLLDLLNRNVCLLQSYIYMNPPIASGSTSFRGGHRIHRSGDTNVETAKDGKCRDGKCVW